MSRLTPTWVDPDNEADVLLRAAGVEVSPMLPRGFREVVADPIDEDEEECEHDDLEGFTCLNCGAEVEMRYRWEHDSGDMER